MASGAKKKVGGKVKDYNINLGDFVTSENLYVTILGSSLQLRTCMHKGCKLYSILVLNEKGDMEGLKNLPVLSSLHTYF
jgi:hypothetical protein